MLGPARGERARWGARLFAVGAIACVPLAAAEPTPADSVPVLVVDAVTMQPIAGAAIAIPGRGALPTDSFGRADVAAARATALEVVVTAAGFVPLHASLTSGAEAAVELRLEPEALRRAEDVSVSARVDEDPAAPGARVLDTAELAELAHVLADDPLRSVHSLPGVAAGDDFAATFAARGLGFGNVGFYVDGVLMSAPFHTVRDVNDGFSLTLLGSNVVQSMTFIGSGAPAGYGDRTGPVLSAVTREGSRERLAGHASLALTGLQATLEGPLGPSRKTTWLASARKSYVDYVLERMDRGGNVLGFHDVTARVAHHPTPGQTVSLGWLHGRSRWRSTVPDLRPQDSRTADAGTDLATLRWHWLASPRTDLRAAVFLANETGRNTTLDGTVRLRSARKQWGLRADAARVVGGHRLETGVVLRQLVDDVLVREFLRRPAAYRIVSNQQTSGGEVGAYAQDAWTGRQGRLGLSLGARVDRFGATGETRTLPRGSVRFDVSSGVRLLAAGGRYAQFPDFQQLHGRGGNAELRAEDATHATVGVEKRFGTGLTLRVDAYDLHLSGGFFHPQAQWRMDGSDLAGAELDAPLLNALTGRSRGLELQVRRQGASGPSGWVAYTFGRARWRDDTGLEFDGDFDQRHTVTVFASWRAAAGWSVGTKLRYGSGFPVAGFYEERADGVYLSAERNAYRPGGYSRWDVRADKAFLFGRVRMTVHGEVVNVLDHTNRRHTGLDHLDVRSGRVTLESDTLFPLLPSIGIAVDF